jgi:hypothetical protein
LRQLRSNLFKCAIVSLLAFFFMHGRMKLLDCPILIQLVDSSFVVRSGRQRVEFAIDLSQYSFVHPLKLFFFELLHCRCLSLCLPAAVGEGGQKGRGQRRRGARGEGRRRAELR